MRARVQWQRTEHFEALIDVPEGMDPLEDLDVEHPILLALEANGAVDAAGEIAYRATEREIDGVIVRRQDEGERLREYSVRWEVDVTAHSPVEAAALARDMQRDPDTRATVFLVGGETAQPVEVDLSTGE